MWVTSCNDRCPDCGHETEPARIRDPEGNVLEVLRDDFAPSGMDLR